MDESVSVAHGVLVFVFVFATACAPMPVAPLACRDASVDFCAELLTTCAKRDSVLVVECRATVAEDDWCACENALEEYNAQ